MLEGNDFTGIPSRKITQTNAFGPDDPVITAPDPTLDENKNIQVAQQNTFRIRELSEEIIYNLVLLMEKTLDRYCMHHGLTTHEIRFICKRCEAEALQKEKAEYERVNRISNQRAPEPPCGGKAGGECS